MPTKLEKTQEAIKSSPVIDKDIIINIPKSQTLKEEKKYKCTCCGNSWDTQKNHFSKSSSVLYQSSSGYINICNDCRDRYYYQLIDLFSGSEEKAIQYMCQQFGWFFHIDALEASRQVSVDRSRISHYLAKKNLGQTILNGSTDIDTLKFDYLNKKDDVIESIDHLRKLQADGLTSVTISAAERWGSGFSDSDYKLLDDHYKMLKKYNPNCDNNQEIFIKSLCNLNLLMVKSLRNGDGDPDKYVKLTEQYSKTFKQAGLKTIEEKDSSNDECLGVTLATISLYTPEEYYQNKALYDDYDEIGNYVDRHMRRPLKNLQYGTADRDSEFFVPETDEVTDDDEE